MKVPKEVLPRFVPIGDDTFVPLESVIARHLDELFPGMEILRHDFFRVTRDADFTVSDEADDLLRAVEDELRRRRFGEVVRLEVASTMDPDMRGYLIEQLAIDESQVIDIDGLLDLDDLWRSTTSTATASCATTPWTPRCRPAFADTDDGDARRARRRCAPATCSSTTPTTRSPAASSASSSRPSRDPDVLAIKITVYRTSDDSALVPALIEAAERGKQAVCLVELKARFDERRNIGWARALEEAGAHVVHGLPGLKTHAKAVLVVRREGAGRAPLRAHRHRQLPRQDGAPVRGLRTLHLRPPDRRRRGGAVQLADRRGAHARVPASDRARRTTCATGSSARSSGPSRRSGQAARRGSC